MPSVLIAGKPVQLQPSNIVGSGGEADIYKLPNSGGKAVKLYKSPRHPDLVGNKIEQLGAKQRAVLIQTKLPAFPKGLPSNVVAPLEMARDPKTGEILGFVLQFVDNVELLTRLGERSFRTQQNIGTEQVLGVFRDLHQTVAGVHKAGAVLGDFNDLNVLFRGQQVWLIDADSMQWGPFPCLAFTQTFVDPLLCVAAPGGLMLHQSHNCYSDWYAYAIMLMRSLLYVGPYGGIYRPANPASRLPAPGRPLKRITVFHPEVTYPKPAVPLTELPPDLREYFEMVFCADKREEFPFALLDTNLWRKGARVITVAVPPRTTHGKVTAIVVFETPGRIVQAVVQRGKLRVLEHHDDAYWRENGHQVIGGAYNPQLRYRLVGDDTLIASGRQLVVLGKETKRFSIDSYGNLPVFDSNDSHYYWLENGLLMRDDQTHDKRPLGDVLRDRTLMWAGPSFGFGIWFAGEMQQAFTFDAHNRGLNTTLQLDRIPGQMLGATAYFGDDVAWFMARFQDKGSNCHRVMVVDRAGQVLAQETFRDPSDDHWLHTIYGHAAIGKMLFAATDDGIVSVQVSAGGFATTLFPDTAPFVSSDSKLLAFAENKQVALLVVGERQIVRLIIS